MPGRLAGKVAIVTGSTSGIGAEIARVFAAEGAKVVVTGRRQDRGEALVAGIEDAGGEASFCRADIAEPDDCHAIVDHACATFGGIDVLVNNAGIFPRGEFEESTTEFWDTMFDVNVRGVWLLCRAAARSMRERGGGSIINMGSGNAFNRAGGRLFIYGCSKSALYGMTMKLAGMLAGDRIRVNWVTVGWVLTEQEYETQQGEGRDAESLHAAAERLPMGRYNTERDNAYGCLFLASDEAAAVTASNLNISAGLCIHI
jgi:NAD(P)-dependent dehydrogenase (short-subunit alcohol dehydrogenase family)